MPQVDVAIGVGRPVVQDVLAFGRALPGGANLAIQILRLPAFQQLGLHLGEVGLHAKAGFRQVNGFLEIHVQFERSGGEPLS